LFWQLRIHDAIFVRKPLRRKDKYPSFSAKTFGLQSRARPEWKRIFKGLILGPIVQRATTPSLAITLARMASPLLQATRPPTRKISSPLTPEKVQTAPALA
jgi:hypothetical protein